MRKIEEKMNKAIRSRENFKLDNTEVFISDTGTAHVYLHDNLIASFTSSDTDFNAWKISCFLLKNDFNAPFNPASLLKILNSFDRLFTWIDIAYKLMGKVGKFKSLEN